MQKGFSQSSYETFVFKLNSSSSFPHLERLEEFTIYPIKEAFDYSNFVDFIKVSFFFTKFFKY